jgi:GH25 family lysozyme M1 (1,4-beta-N-acetylmuramidase)
LIKKKYLSNNKVKIVALIFGIMVAFTGCGNSAPVKTELKKETAKDTGSKKTKKEKVNAEQTKKPFHFVDVHGQGYDTIIDPDIPENVYDKSKYNNSDGKMKYEDSRHSSRIGIDVSYHQGNIDWKQVKAAGYDFVILRIAYRGYSQAGRLVQDSKFEEYYDGAKSAGLDVGVYFFAQAVNENEAEEEADFVLNILNGRKLELPVTYDPESILNDTARTDNVTKEQFTKNAVTFCNRINDAGYKPMIYANMLWEAFELDLTKLSDVPVWYADYETLPQTPYNYEYWQYSNEGKVPGVQGNCDLDIQIIKNE